jgi:V/A-type H+-transporting ATPase subunit B
MPGGDITHPVPDLTGYITEGQIVLSPEVHGRGVDPAIDALSSLSRLMRRGAGPDRTRPDHLELSSQVYAALARAQQAKDLSELVGIDALSVTDRRYIEFAEAFEARFLTQGPEEDRSLDATLDLAWEVVSILPRRELTMVSPEMIRRHLPEELR